MAPGQQTVRVQPATRRRQNQGFIANAYQALTDAENQSVIKSMAIFGASVAFFASSWSEYLLPPLFF